MKCALTLLFALCLLCSGAEIHVSPGASGSGTLGSPGSVTLVLSNGLGVAAGDTVWMHEGTYNNGTNIVNATLDAGASAFVTFRPYPGATVKWNFPFRYGTKQGYRFVDIEFYDSNKAIREEAIGYIDSSSNTATNYEYINCVFHDLPGVFTGYAGGRVRGCIFWYVGQHRRDHLIYPYCLEFTGSIAYWTSGDGIEQGLGLLNLSSNIIAGTGITVNSPEKTLLLTLSTNINVRKNLIHDYHTLNQAGLHIQNSSGAVVADNKISAPTPLIVNDAAGHVYTLTNNTLFANKSGTFYVAQLNGPSGTYIWDWMSYFDVNDTVLFLYVAAPENFVEWKADTGFDVNSTTSNASNPPDTVDVFHNQDNKFRTHVGIFNWSGAHNVTVNLAGIIQAGNRYTVRSAQDYNGALVQSGTFNGTSISLPMTNLNVAPVLYGTNVQPTASSPNFAAFVVVAGGAYASGMNFNGVLR